jgi:GNAT superfamily N-acetyltransferase
VITVVPVEPGTELLTSVRELWRRHSDTLGFFPEGAFDDYANKRCILAALDSDGLLLGYTLFRTTNRLKATIAHLCVDPKARRQGVARELFRAARARVRGCDHIIVRCRRDFNASSLWPRLGFRAVGEGTGKGNDPQILTIWCHEINRPPLLAALDRHHDDRMRVVIDANVFFDLDEAPRAAAREESKSLLADWLGEFIELCVTDEIYNEIDRNDDSIHRARQRSRVEQFRVLPSDEHREEQILAELEDRFRSWTSDSGRSDMRQLARTISGGAMYFVTRDGRVREQADELSERFGLVIVSPFELILKFDELRREEEYQPKRFIAAGLNEFKPRGLEDLEQIADLLHVGLSSPKPRRRTLGRLRDILAAPDYFEFSCITGNDGALIAAYAVERRAPDILVVPLFAVADSAIGRTAAQHFAEKLTALAATEGRTVIMFKDDAGFHRIGEVLSDAGFSKDEDHWIKIALPDVSSAIDLAIKLDCIGAIHPQAKSFAARAATHLRSEEQWSQSSLQDMIHIERALWPAKIVGANLPCYIVPIRPIWAEQLFDLYLAEQTFFGADPKLAMNSENAYYRSAKPAILTAPARLLWYVSHDKAYTGTKAVRACSYLDEILIAPPKDAFKRFQRLGVYKWPNVLEVANHDINKEVMAFRFSKTELLRQPIRWDQLQKELRRNGAKGSQIQSPLQISESCFLKLYKIGMGIT